MNTNHYIGIDQICVGLYIHLDLSWMNHPFTLSNFKIHNEDQIEKIKQIGLKKLRYDPKRSECEPLDLNAEVPSNLEHPSIKAEAITHLEVKPTKEPSIEQVKRERLKQLHHAIDESEKKFVAVSDVVKSVNQNMLTSPKACIDQATSVVDEIVEMALTEKDIVIHALNGNRSSDAHYQHPLNVTVLSLMLAKSLSISKEEMQLLGISAMLHDIGKTSINDTILKKTEPSKEELAEYQLHSVYGAQLIHKLGLPSRIGRILLQHHECWDGSGYPNHLKGDQIDPLANIIYLVNTYDNLCNPLQYSEAKSPYETLRLMFTHLRAKCSDELLKHFIKSLGVYPPGSIVKLSDGNHATVISVNPDQPLRPYIQLQDDGVSIAPQILNLQDEANLSITNCLNINQLSPTLLRTLNPRKRVNYFIDNVPSDS
jgi:putative nucleotidyltransferase with HDIG domain